MRKPFQILVIPYKRKQEGLLYGVFLRKKPKIWQFISGGGEDQETIVETAIREFKEETGHTIKEDNLLKLDTCSTIPVVNITGEFTWGQDTYVVPEYTFAIKMDDDSIILSEEHEMLKWLTFKQAMETLQYDSNKTALWELNERLKREKGN